MKNSSNKNVVLIMGKPSSGKSHSLYYLDDPKSVLYLNTDRKELPFPDNFALSKSIEEPMQAIELIMKAENEPKIKTVVLDTLTFLMDMYENQVLPKFTNIQKGWGEYAQFYQTLLSLIKNSKKDFIIFAHEAEANEEVEGITEVYVPIKGSTRKRGVEADFSNILQAKSIKVSVAEAHPNSKLNITDEELEDGIKKVFVTRVTKDTLGHKMRSAWRLWSRDELYIDNNIGVVMETIKTYYNGEK